MGPGDGARQSAIDTAYVLGRLIALEGWVLLTGGRDRGVMEAASAGARSAGGLTIGILPTEDNADTSEFVDVPILTGLGSARNNINVLTSDALIVIADGIGPGTASEAALALKARKRIVLLGADSVTASFFQELAKDLVSLAETPEDAVALAKVRFS